MRRSPPCPCSSGALYRGCCEPLHLGAREADSPAALMRSRYAAFALGAVDYLYRTLHPSHPDRAAPEALVRRSIAEFARSHRFTGLEILDARAEGADGVAQVLFYAKVFTKGRDRSFAECSDFSRSDGAWRYLSGVTRAGPPPARDIDAFLAAAR